MVYMDIEGDTVEQAQEKAVAILKLSEKDLTFEVLEKGKAAFLGLGKAVPALVRVYYKEEDVKSVAEDATLDSKELLDKVENIVKLIDPETKVEIVSTENDRFKLSLKSENVSHIIGKHGKALAALQTVVNALLQKYENRFKIIIDVDYYNKKKDMQLLSWAKQQANRVVQEKRPIVLKSLNSYERRLIHVELKSRENLVVESKGEGKIKNMKLSPKR